MPPARRVPLVSSSSSATMRPIRPPQPETPILSSAICCSCRLKLREGRGKCKRGAGPLPTTRRILYTIGFMALLRSVATVGGYTMMSRVLGFVRDMLTAQFLGAGPVADAFFVALRLPNLFRSFFAEGAFSAAFVPIFAGMIAKEGRTPARLFAEEAMAMLTT